MKRLENLALDPAVFCQKVGCFFSSISGRSLRREFGEVLVEKHGWIKRSVHFSTMSRTTRANNFFQFINPAAKDFYLNYSFYEIEARVFFGFNANVISKGVKRKRAMACTSKYSASHMRDMLRIEKLGDAMEAQKILGEGIFNMVRRNRETFFKRIQQ